MKRMIALSLAASSMLAAMLQTVSAAEEFTMRIAAGAASNGNICKGYLDVWAEKVKAESNGRIGYKLFCDGVLGKIGETITRVEGGVADVGWDAPLSYGNRFAPFGVVGVPGLYTNPEDAGGALWKAYEAGQLGKVEGVKVGWLQAFSNLSLWMAKEPSAADKLSGQKIIVASPMRASIISNGGGIPVSPRVNEYYQGISKGTADGLLTAVGPINDFKIDELLDYVATGPFGGALSMIVINQAWYDSLPADLRKVIDDNTGYETSRWASAYIGSQEGLQLQHMVDQQHLVLHPLTAEEIKSWQTAFDAAKKEWLASTPGGDAALKAFQEEIQSK